MSKPIAVYKLTPSQIALVDRLAGSEGGVAMDGLSYPEIVCYQELAKLGMADMAVGSRRRVAIVLTNLGQQVRGRGYLSKVPVVRLTQPQIGLLRFLAGNETGYRLDQIPSHMIDVCRRMGLRGWVEWRDTGYARRRACLTPAGRQILTLVDAPEAAGQCSSC
ncbi:hypothetical protein [Devosia sp. RR2S18]|uniref:hypothetical protein n=1 Tax=Devosia rhizosphaerae TaxID=3049774 RepID=UPI00253F9359|nr:hypothetical protein [Devosia sp. RR2S18]WIJ23416.1 hypothetical protein QOV41_09970 [Devosia sp. RR2S18]